MNDDDKLFWTIVISIILSFLFGLIIALWFPQ